LLALAAITGCQTFMAQNNKPTFIIVPGAWGGGWDWKRVGDQLTADGHTVYRPSLSGLGEHNNFTSTNIDLDTHIQDIANIILWENLHDVVLVGHSYGGMVITGVADRMPDRIRNVIYVDALLPENGESVSSIVEKSELPQAIDGYMITPWASNSPPPHDTPMSAATFYEPITLTNQAVAIKLSTTYIQIVEKGKNPEQAESYPFLLRAKKHGWQTWTVEGEHTMERSQPTELAELLEKALN
jgi:pimeloyl-ACP methyl ester carboxylesterase